MTVSTLLALHVGQHVALHCDGANVLRGTVAARFDNRLAIAWTGGRGGECQVSRDDDLAGFAGNLEAVGESPAGLDEPTVVVGAD